MKEVEPDRQFDDDVVQMSPEDFDPDIYNFITLARIYDLVAVIARAVNPVEAKVVLDAHERGEIVGDPPHLGG